LISTVLLELVELEELEGGMGTGDIDVCLILGFGGFMGGDPILTLSISRIPTANKEGMGF